ncbi:5-hydroxymethyl-dUMP N-hydrolase [Rhinophrynus dorsalis]
MARLRVYFCGSIRGGREDLELYGRIIRELSRFGTVLTEHIANPEISHRGNVIKPSAHTPQMQQDILPVVVAEVTQPSLGVGYEIGRAVDMDKKILCLFRPSCGRVLSAMIRGAQNEKTVLVRDYEVPELEGILSEYFKATFPSL